MSLEDMSLDDAAAKALNKFTGVVPKGQLQRVEGAGFSGSTLWQVSAVDGPLCLKCSPRYASPSRMPSIHSFINHTRDAGLQFLPRFYATSGGETIVEHTGCGWELMTWLPGEPDRSATPAKERVQSAFRALGTFHLAGEKWRETGGDQPELLRPAPAIAERLARVQELTAEGIPSVIAAVRERRIPVLDDLAEQWIPLRRIPPKDLQPRLMFAVQQKYRLLPAIRDLWREHVLFTGNSVTGFIDFGALRLDVFHVDLARLVGSLAGDHAELRSVGVRAYSEIRPLLSADVELINLLDYAGTWIAGWNWLDWLYREEREFHSLAAVRERLMYLLSRQIN